MLFDVVLAVLPNPGSRLIPVAYNICRLCMWPRRYVSKEKKKVWNIKIKGKKKHLVGIVTWVYVYCTITVRVIDSRLRRLYILASIYVYVCA